MRRPRRAPGDADRRDGRRRVRRAAGYADGWIWAAGRRTSSPRARRSWKPRGATPAATGAAHGVAVLLLAGRRRQAHADAYLKDYYGFLGEYAAEIAGSAATDADTIRGYVQGFTAVGCDELICFPCNPDPGQVDLLADALDLARPRSAPDGGAAPTEPRGDRGLLVGEEDAVARLKKPRRSRLSATGQSRRP